MSRLEYQRSLQLDRIAAAVDATAVDADIVNAAVALRVLFHQTASSVSLLDQLSDSAGLALPDSTGAAAGYAIEFGLKADATQPRGISAHGIRHVSVFDPAAPRVPWERWWHGLALHSPLDATAKTRKQLVCAVANKGGGAHVDRSSWYDALVGSARPVWVGIGERGPSGWINFTISHEEPTAAHGEARITESFNRLGYAVIQRIAAESLTGLRPDVEVGPQTFTGG